MYTIFYDINLLLVDTIMDSLHMLFNTELKVANNQIEHNKLCSNVSKTHYIIFQKPSIKPVIPSIKIEENTLHINQS